MRTHIPRRKVGKKYFTHQCMESGTSVYHVIMRQGDGGISSDGDQLIGGGDNSLVVEHAKDVYHRNEMKMTKQCLDSLYDQARISGNWEKFAPQITHLENRMRWSQRDQPTGK